MVRFGDQHLVAFAKCGGSSSVRTGHARRIGGNTRGSRTMRKHMIGLGAVVGLATLSTAAQAATATSNFQVKLTITPQCLVSSPSDLNFLSSGFLSAAIDKTTDIFVSCTNT